MFELLDQPLSHDCEVKKTLLLNRGIALWDVLQFCERRGSLDSNIKNETPNDFASFYKEHPLIRHVFFTSAKAKKYYDHYVKRKSDYLYSLLPSPSRANTWKTIDEKRKEILQYV